MPGALVAFAGQLVRADAHGRAVITATLTAPGRRTARAGALGYRKDDALARVLAAR